MSDEKPDKNPSDVEGVVSTIPFREMFELLTECMKDTQYWKIEGFVEKPEGLKQPCDCVRFDHEYVDQSNGIGGDDYYGDTYLPMLDGGYLKIYYSC